VRVISQRKGGGGGIIKCLGYVGMWKLCGWYKDFIEDATGRSGEGSRALNMHTENDARDLCSKESCWCKYILHTGVAVDTLLHLLAFLW
jgi:hypothetical protein